jgi:hypothetical protein
LRRERGQGERDGERATASESERDSESGRERRERACVAESERERKRAREGERLKEERRMEGGRQAGVHRDVSLFATGHVRPAATWHRCQNRTLQREREGRDLSVSHARMLAHSNSRTQDPLAHDTLAHRHTRTQTHVHRAPPSSSQSPQGPPTSATAPTGVALSGLPWPQPRAGHSLKFCPHSILVCQGDPPPLRCCPHPRGWQRWRQGPRHQSQFCPTWSSLWCPCVWVRVHA